MPRYPITQKGLDELVSELAHLKKVERPATVKAVQDARAHGDLSENAEYDAAREKLSHIQSRINFLESRIAESEIIEVNTVGASTIIFGCKVKIRDLEDNSEEEYTLVGASEANPAQGKLSTASPIGKALIGRARNDIVDVTTPGGTIKLQIVDFC